MQNQTKTQKNKVRYGVFYRSSGRWIGPYHGKTYSASAVTRNPFKSDVKFLKNYVLKAKVAVMTVG